MSVNPYQSHRSHDDSTRSTPKILLGIGAGTIAFVVGLAWVKFQRLFPDDVNPSLYVTAELIAYSGVLATIGFGVGAGVSNLFARLAPSTTTSAKAVQFGWNIAPAIFSILIGTGWCAFGLLGLFSLLDGMDTWDFYTGLPIRELVFQVVLYGSCVTAGACCLIAGRLWIRTAYRRAVLYTGIGVIGPVVAYIILFSVCDKLIRYMI